MKTNTDKNQRNIKLLLSGFNKSQKLDLAPVLKAGFPSPAETDETGIFDFNVDMIHHPETTFYGRVSGDSMIDAGINDGDLVVIDRSIEPKKGDIIIAFLNREFTMKYYDDTHKDEGYIELVPANKAYPRFKVTKEDDFMVWGVVQCSIRRLHR